MNGPAPFTFKSRKEPCRGMLLQMKGAGPSEHSARKKGKLSTSHRYDLLPLLPSGPGGVQRELVVYDFPDGKVKNNF